MAESALRFAVVIAVGEYLTLIFNVAKATLRRPPSFT